MLTDDKECAAFEENVIGRIDDSDPIFWRVTTGDISEQRVDTSENMVRYYERESHMRLIVGYNDARGEVIYSDSWGEGHAHKRMDAQDALSITTGMYYLKANGVLWEEGHPMRIFNEDKFRELKERN